MMNPRGKITVIVLGMVAGLSVAVAGAGLMLQMRERDLRLAKERELVLVKSQNEDLGRQLDDAKEARAELEEQLSRVRLDFEQAAKQLDDERKAKAELAKSVDERQREIDRLGKDLAQATSERTTLEEQLAQLKTQQEEAQKQLEELQQAKTQLETKVLELSGGPAATVELEKVVVSDFPGLQQPAPAGMIGGPGAQPASVVQGQVLVINREYDFIVVSLGRNQGLGIGQELQIIRGQDILGRVKVEKLYDELSAAAILPGTKEDAIREGDVVRAI